MKIYQNEPKVQHPHNSAQAKEGSKDTYLTQLDRKHHGNLLQVQLGAHRVKTVIGTGQGSATPGVGRPPPGVARPLLHKVVSRSYAEAVHAGISTKIAMNIAPPPQRMEACKELSGLDSSSTPIKGGHPLLISHNTQGRRVHLT
jgi:hypothetical protein